MVSFGSAVPVQGRGSARGCWASGLPVGAAQAAGAALCGLFWGLTCALLLPEAALLVRDGHCLLITCPGSPAAGWRLGLKPRSSAGRELG